MRTALARVLTAAACFGCAYAQTPVEIADGRSGGEWVDLSEWAAAAPVRQANEAARAYWRGQDASYEEDLRIFSVAEGAFTEPDVQQQAVLFVMSVWPRCCPKTGLAIVEGDRLVRNVAFEGVAQELAAVPDLDGDGRDELAFTGEFGMGGQVSRSVTLASFGADGLADWGTTSILDSACAAGHDGASAARVLALPGPTFTVERFTQASCEAETWAPAGEPEPLDLVAPEESTYVDLPVR